MIKRYSRQEMADVWEPTNKFQKWLDVELAACKAHVELGNIPEASYKTICEKANFNVERIDEIESDIHHDVIAFLTCVAEYIGEDSRYVHLGLTSSDVVDTAFSLLIQDAGTILLKDIEDNDPAGIKELKLELKENGYAMGFRLNTLINQVRSGFFGYQAQRFQRRRDEIKVWIRYDKETRSSITSLEEMRVISPQGVRVPLREIANYEIQRGEISINHLDGNREIRLDADLKNPKTSATEIVQEIKTEILPLLRRQYPSVTASFDGQSREANKTTTSAAATMPIVVFMIFAIIAFTYRSVSQPLILLVMIPFSLIGVAWGHWLHGYPINISSFLGIIALIGIVVNDGLVLIGKFNTNLRSGMKFNESLMAAGKSRFRPIFLTSVTTIAGLGPLIFEKSLQAQFLIPMAVSIAYGILAATVLTLVFLPMMLTLGNSMKVWALWFWTGTKPTKESVERAVKELNISYE